MWVGKTYTGLGGRHRRVVAGKHQVAEVALRAGELAVGGEGASDV